MSFSENRFPLFRNMRYALSFAISASETSKLA
jgi:hypothetical protein